MTNNILIKNIYYMLSYTFKELKKENYSCISSENFEDVEDLLAEILIIGLTKQIKNGLDRSYINKAENLSTIKGKIDIRESLYNIMNQRNKLFCHFEEYFEDNLYNRVLKTVCLGLLKSNKVKQGKKVRLRKLLLYFDQVSFVDLSRIQWKKMVFYRQNRSYALLMNICYYIYKSLLLTTDPGEFKMAHFLDQDLPNLYEKFVLEYYKKHFSECKVSAKKIQWDLISEDKDWEVFLPEMKSDITIEYRDQIIIIDTKYYSKSMIQSYYGKKKKLLSANLYQIYTYVKNTDKERKGNVSGILLYAKSDEEISPDYSYLSGGNRFQVKTLDLNSEFKEISRQLNQIVFDNLEGISYPTPFTNF